MPRQRAAEEQPESTATSWPWRRPPPQRGLRTASWTADLRTETSLSKPTGNADILIFPARQTACVKIWTNTVNYASNSVGMEVVPKRENHSNAFLVGSRCGYCLLERSLPRAEPGPALFNQDSCINFVWYLHISNIDCAFGLAR